MGPGLPPSQTAYIDTRVMRSPSTTTSAAASGPRRLTRSPPDGRSSRDVSGRGTGSVVSETATTAVRSQFDEPAVPQPVAGCGTTLLSHGPEGAGASCKSATSTSPA